MPKPGCGTIALREMDVFRAIREIADAGFAGVEIWGRAEHISDPVDWKHVESIAQTIKKCKLQVSMYGSYVSVGNEDWKQKAEESLRICKIINAPVMRIWAGGKEPHQADEDYWKEMVARQKVFCQMAADAGVILAIEMHGGTLAFTIPGSERFLAEVDHPSLKLNFQVTDNEPNYLDRAIPTLGAHVVNIHAQNHRTEIESDGKEVRPLVLIEEGDFDYAELLGRLKPYGFDGFIEVEFLKGDFGCGGEEVMLDSLKKDAAYLRRICRL